MFLRLFLILCFVAHAVVALPAENAQKTLIVGSEEDFPPFAVGKTDETASGYTVDLWKEVAKEAGLKYSLRVRPWGQILQEFKDGEVDVLINIAQSEERAQYTDFSVPHVTVHGAIFVRKDETGILSEADLAGKSIIVFKSDLAHEYAVAKGWHKQIVIVTTPQEGLLLLSSGKHDAMLLSKLAGMQTIRELGLKNIKALEAHAGYAQKFSFGVHKGNAELLAQLNEGLALTKASDAYDTIYGKWFGIYEEHKPTLRDILPYLAPFIIITFIVGSYNFRKRRMERKQERLALTASEQNLRLILDSAGEAIYGIDLKGNCTFCNIACVKILGYGHQNDLLGKNMHNLIHHSHQDGTAYPVKECRIYKAFQEGKGSYVDDEVLWRSDGTSFSAEYRSYPQIRDGKPVGAVVTFIDITERKIAREQLETLSQRLWLATSSARLGIWDWNIRENCMIWDRRMFELYGITQETFPSTLDAWTNGLHPEDKEKAIADCQAALNGDREFDTVFRVMHPDGAIKYLKANAHVIRGADGTAERMIGINADITESKHAEEEKLALEQHYHHSQKLESLGVLAGGIAHDFNNILAVIIGNCGMIHVDPGNTASYIPEIELAADRAAGLCRQMLAYAGKAQFIQAKVKIDSLVAETIQMLRASLPKNAAITFESAADTPCITADASQISQVALNLIINASEAIGDEHGEVRVTLSKAVITKDHPEMDYLGKTIPPCCYACLEVTDTGCGMSEETYKRIFEPFFTTKFAGRGLGMSATLGIITSHKGAMQLFTQQGRGTTFKVFLPAQADDSVVDTFVHSIAQSEPWKGTGTVLLVEDEEQVKLLAKTMLTTLGFTVFAASNGKEALELYQKDAAEITIVLTDIGMPIMDGYELFNALKKLNPDLPIIISSGFGEVDVSSRIAREDVAGIIGKPYTLGGLREAMKSAVEGLLPKYSGK